MKHNYPGMLIVFEGIDGAGKGTQIELLKPFALHSGNGLPVLVTKEPGGTELGWEIRKLLFETIGTRHIAPSARQLMCLAAHIQHSETVIRPALAAGKIVICDRYLYSDLAYQEQDTHPMLTELKKTLMGPQPDLLFHLHGDPWTLLQRAKARQPVDMDVNQEDKLWSDAERLREIQNNYFRLFLPLCAGEKGHPLFPPFLAPYRGIDVEVRSAADIFEKDILPVTLRAIREHFLGRHGRRIEASHIRR